ncbi:hypothetical protein ARSEF1564_010126 [Beauveria bassiana]
MVSYLRAIAPSSLTYNVGTMSSLARLDTLFGPQLPGHFDFTLCFEHVMLWLVPAGIVILATPLYFNKAVRAQRQVQPGILLWVKLACVLALVAIQASNIALWHKTEYFHSEVTVAASAMSLAASICTFGIVAITHTYALQPSAFLSVFFSITMLFDIAMTRSYFLRGSLSAIAVSQVCVVILKLMLIVLEEVPKRGLYRSQYMRSAVSAETASGFWNRSLFLWLNPLLYFGWFHTLTADNLPNIADELLSEKLFDQFVPYWAQVSKISKRALAIALFRTLTWQLIQVLLPRLAFIGATIAQPFLLLRTVQAVSTGNVDRSTAGGLIGATALIYCGLAVRNNTREKRIVSILTIALLNLQITRALYEHWEYRVITSTRGILVVAIYDKLLRLRSEDLENSAALTLMSTDVEGSGQIVQLAYESWSCVIQLGLGIWFLYRFIGPACFLIVVPVFATFVGSIIAGKMIATTRTATNAETQKRVAATSNILAQMKSVKGMGLSSALSACIEEKRKLEINTAMRERYSVLWVFGFGAINYTVTPAIVIAGAYFWTRADNPMSVAELFTVIAILSLSTGPLISLFRSINGWAAGFASIGRIFDYLVQEELQDPRDTPKGVDVPASTEKVSSSPPRSPFAVQLNCVSVTSPTTGPVLKDVTLAIPWGSLCMVWGPISCGKSTFLKLLLGEVTLNSGSIAVGSKIIAYCSQECWIPNCTVRQAIIGQLKFNESRYREIVRACTLDVDLAELPDGDQTQTGSGGCNLSGGQRQRLSLARAAYAQEQIMVVDDIFSSVDPETAAAIFGNLFGPEGMVRQWNCTVIMSTNRLELLDYANQVYQFGKNGRVELQSDDWEAASVASDRSGHASNAEDEDDGQQHAVRNEDTEPPQIKVKDEENEGEYLRNVKAGDLSLYSYFLSSAGIFPILGWTLLAMIAAVGEWAPVIFLRIWYGRNPSNPYYFIGYAGCAMFCVIFNITSSAFYFTFVYKKITKEIHRKLLLATMGATPQYLNETDSGVLLNRFSQDISLITRRLSLLANQFMFLTFTTLLEIAIIAAGSVYSMPVMLLLTVVLFLTQLYYLRTSRQLRQLELESSSAIFTHFTESNEGIHHIRSFNWQESYRQKLYAKLDRSQKPTYLLYCIQRWLTLSMDIMSAVASIVLIGVVTTLPGKTSNAAVGLAMLSLMGFSGTATVYVQLWTSFETALGAVRRIKQFVMSTPQEQDALSGPSPPINWPSAGKIDFNTLTATYRTTDGGEHKAIDNATVTIRAGHKIGIMGRTGSGKSTVLSAMLRLVNCTGSISIDGHDIRMVPREFLRSKITTITQDGLRLKASLRFNLFPFESEKPSDDDMIGVLQDVQLWTHVHLNGGLDADYSSMRFSSGQKQLMFLARGILHQAKTGNKIVMIDEVTSSLALDTEDDIQALIDECFEGCTIILVSHRMESFNTVDGVLKFDSGRLCNVLRRRSNGDLVEVKDV